MYDISGNSSFEGLGTSISQDIHPDYDTNSNIDEVPRRKVNDQRERSINKLTRTLGAHPLTIMEDRQTTKSPEPNSHHQWDSFESDSMLETDALSSPITFAPSSIENVSHPNRTPTPHTTSSDIDSNFTTSTREEISFQSHTSPSPEPSSSRMPHLRVSTHTDAVPVPYDVSSDLNEPVTKSDWLVPLNEVVISIRRNAPSKPQSWTGEWNREIKDVIRDLRRL